MRPNTSKLLVPLLLLALLAGACGGGKPNAAPDVVKKFRESKASDIKPPDRTDTRKLAQPGLTLATNSPTWQKLVDSPSPDGAVVLFVLPGGPAANLALARGDLITKVDGKRVTNQEQALTLLRSARGETRKLTITGKGGKERTVNVKGQLPKDRPRKYLNTEIEGNPNDPVLRYLRAQSADNCGTKITAGCGTLADKLADLDKALEMQPQFVDALAARGSIVFNRRVTTKDKKQQDAFVNQALANWSNALSIDPRNADTLVLQANAEIAVGKVSQGLTDANKAIRIDPNIAAANWAVAQAQLKLRKPDKAAGPARAAIELNPYTNLNYYRTLAEAFKDLKRKTDCATTLNAPVAYLEGTKVKALKTEAEHLQDEAKKNCG